MHDIDHSSYELGAIQLKLRRDLSFRRQSFGDEPCYVIEDATASRFYRVGVSEYTFLSLLDGNTSIADAVAHCATQLVQIRLPKRKPRRCVAGSFRIRWHQQRSHAPQHV